MQTRIETLESQVQHISQFETLFASTNYQEFMTRLPDFNQYMGEHFPEIAKAVFEDFQFEKGSDRQKSAKSCRYSLNNLVTTNLSDELLTGNRASILLTHSIKQIGLYFKNLEERQISAQTISPTKVGQIMSYASDALGTLVETVVNTESSQKNLLLQLRQLIAEQKSHWEKALQTERENIAAAEQEAVRVAQEERDRAAVEEQEARDNAAAEEQETLRVAQEARDKAAASRTKCIRYVSATALAASGVSLIATSALLQYYPHFAIMAGIHVPPVALISLALVGLALVLLALYFMYRIAYTPALTSTLPASTDINPKPSCLARITKYTSCCFKLFKKQDGATANAGNTATNGAGQPAATPDTTSASASV
jgi:hypothetical protein